MERRLEIAATILTSGRYSARALRWHALTYVQIAPARHTHAAEGSVDLPPHDFAVRGVLKEAWRPSYRRVICSRPARRWT